MLLLQLAPHQRPLLTPSTLVITELLLHLVLMEVLVVLAVQAQPEHLVKLSITVVILLEHTLLVEQLQYPMLLEIVIVIQLPLL